MSSSTTEFHKIWIAQCDATEGIRDHFGTKDALGYPCIAIVPVAAAANELGQAEGRGGHKGTMFSTCEKLERQCGAGYAFSPSSFIHGLASPLLPVSAGSLQLTPDERDQFVDRLILRISENEISAFAFLQSERSERSTTFRA
jgi:hypothetical protein